VELIRKLALATAVSGQSTAAFADQTIHCFHITQISLKLINNNNTNNTDGSY